MMTLVSLTSPWRTPARWADSSASSNWSMTCSSAAWGGSGVTDSHCARFKPATCSIAMKARPSASSIWWMVTMPG